MGSVSARAAVGKEAQTEEENRPRGK